MIHNITANLLEKNPQGPAKGSLKVVRSSIPSEGQSLQMFGGFTFSRHAIHPIEDPKAAKDELTKNIILT